MKKIIILLCAILLSTPVYSKASSTETNYSYEQNAVSNFRPLNLEEKVIKRMLKTLNKQIKKAPNDISLRFSRIDIYIDRKDFRSVFKELEEIERIASNDEETLCNVLNYYGLLGNYEQVARLSSKVLSINPKNAFANWAKIHLLLEDENYEELLNFITQNETNLTGVKGLYYYRGLAKLYLAGNENDNLVKNAILDFNKSIEKKEYIENSKFLRGLAKIYFREYKEAFEDLIACKGCDSVTTKPFYEQLSYIYSCAKLGNAKYSSTGTLKSFELPEWIKNGASTCLIANVSPSSIQSLSTRINNANVLNSQEKSYILETIKLIKENGQNSQIAVVNEYINPKNMGLGLIAVSSYYGATPKEVKGCNKETYDKVLANQYYCLLSNCSKEIGYEDIDNFYEQVYNISKAQAHDYLFNLCGKALIDEFADDSIAETIAIRAISYITKTGETDAKAKKVLEEAYSALGCIKLKQNKLSAAKTYLELAIKYGAPKYSTYELLASACEIYENNFDAINYYTKMLNIKQTSDAFKKRGILKAKLGDYTAAITDFTLAIKKNPKDAEAYFRRGEIYSKQRKYLNAKNDFLQSAKYKPDFANTYSQIAFCCLELNNKNEAVTYFEKAKGLYLKENNINMYTRCIDIINRIKGYKY